MLLQQALWWRELHLAISHCHPYFSVWVSLTGIGGQTVNVPLLHSKFFRPSGRDLWILLMAYCQSGDSNNRSLNGLLGRTCRISCNQSAGNFGKSKILNPWYWLLGELAWRGRGTGFQLTRQVLQQTQRLLRECGLRYLSVLSHLLARIGVQINFHARFKNFWQDHWPR